MRWDGTRGRGWEEGPDPKARGGQGGDGGLGGGGARPFALFFLPFSRLLDWFGSFAPSRGLRRCDGATVRVRCAVATVPACAAPGPGLAALRRWRARQVGFRRAR